MQNVWGNWKAACNQSNKQSKFKMNEWMNDLLKLVYLVFGSFGPPYINVSTAHRYDT